MCSDDCSLQDLGSSSPSSTSGVSFTICAPVFFFLLFGRTVYFPRRPSRPSRVSRSSYLTSHCLLLRSTSGPLKVEEGDVPNKTPVECRVGHLLPDAPLGPPHVTLSLLRREYSGTVNPCTPTHLYVPPRVGPDPWTN